MSSGAAAEEPYWSRDLAALSAALGSGPNGLSPDEATQRLARVGDNSVEEVSSVSTLRLLVRQFESPLILILVVAAALSLALREWSEAGIILAIIFGSSLLSFFQEYRASSAVAQLKRRLELSTRVQRGGKTLAVPLRTIVPGDVILLSAGNLIPADGRVIEAQDFLVSESAMTGESFPVEKRPGIVPPEAPIAARTNAVFLGSSVRSGTARVLAVETGLRTEYGAIAARLRARPPDSDFARGVRQFGIMLIRVMAVIVLSVLMVNMLLGRPALESLLFAAALAVGISPEMLPAIISVTLSAGARRMSERGVLVRRLDAIEDLGGMDILCTDKTGTLTEGTTELRDALDADGQPSREVLRLAFLNASLETGIANPLDSAIVESGARQGLTASGYAKIDEIPYDFKRRRLTIVIAPVATPGEHLIVTKGAFSEVLEVCAFVETTAGQIALDDARRKALAAAFAAHGEEGLRVLALATRRVPARPDYGFGDESDMCLGGLLLFHDPPKADARTTIAGLAALGIRTKLISGDNRHVTANLARAVGLDPGSMLTGEELAGLHDEALWNRAPRTDLFVEIDPQQKERIVRALQRTGHCVGFLGDGINDAPALYAADVGISVAGAVDVARESADIVLLKPSLGVLRAGVEDGRRTFANTLKYISITTSANFGNMISMALAAPFLPFLPLLAKQILLNNFLSDIPSIAISTDTVDPEQVTKPQRWDIREIQRFMVVFGLVSSIFDLLTFAALLFVFHAGEATFQTTWFVISVLTELAVVLVLRTRRPAWQSAPSAALLWSTVAIVAVTLATPYLGPLSALFGLVPLSAAEMAVIGGILVAYIVATELTKRWFFGAMRNATRRRQRAP